MPLARGAWAEALAPGLNMRTFNAYRKHPEFYRRIANVQTSKKAWEDDYRLAGFGPLAPKGELETTILDEPIKIGGARYIHKTYALAFAISKELRDDDQYGIMTDLASELGLSAYWTTELYGHDVYNNGFVTTKYVGRDGKALFATDHPVQGTGGVQANKPAVDTDISEAALEAAVGAFDAQINERGMPIALRPKVLLVNPAQRMTVKRLLDSTGRPGTANNDVNALADEGIVPISDPWITDTDAWFLLAEPTELDIKFYWREQMDTKTWDDDNADATFHKVRQRHSVGFGDHRGTYGSPGA